MGLHGVLAVICIAMFEEREAIDLSMSRPPEKVSLQSSVKSFKGRKNRTECEAWWLLSKVRTINAETLDFTHGNRCMLIRKGESIDQP